MNYMRVGFDVCPRPNKVAIELSGVQFWSEIILVTSNRTRATRSFDFEITPLQLHSTQFNYHYKLCVCDLTKFGSLQKGTTGNSLRHPKIESNLFMRIVKRHLFFTT